MRRRADGEGVKLEGMPKLVDARHRDEAVLAREVLESCGLLKLEKCHLIGELGTL